MQKSFIILCAAILSINLATSQENTSDFTLKNKHNSIYAELGGNSGVYSLNYDYTFLLTERTKLAVGTGLFVIKFGNNDPCFESSNKPLFFLAPEANLLFGKKITSS